MSSALAMSHSVILTVMLVIVTPNSSRAEGPCVSPQELQSYDSNKGVPELGPATSGLSTPTLEPAPIVSGRSVQNDDAISGEDTLAENAWDFTKPDSIPGFASTPYGDR